MPLADEFQRAVDALPPDWTDLRFDLRIEDDERYIEAATLLAQVNAQGYSKSDWHWRINVAHEFGHAAAPETVRGTLKLLDDQGIDGEIAFREARSGRVEVVQMWGRPESVRQEFRRAGTVKIALLCSDLLFGSKIQGGLKAAGHDVGFVKDAAALDGAEVLVVDLGEVVPDPPGPPVRSLGFYSHVDVETRKRAEAAGFDLVVPRSRMAREMALLVEKVAA